MISLPRKYSFAIRLYSHRHTCSQALQVRTSCYHTTTLPPTCVRQGRMNDFCSPAQSSPAQTPPALTLLYFLLVLSLSLSDLHSYHLLSSACLPASPSSYHHTSRHCRIRYTYLYIRASSRRIDKLSISPLICVARAKAAKHNETLAKHPWTFSRKRKHARMCYLC